ncbi:hypothetical protein E4T56_gene9983 [Termitomyces sp. T112]|nr:hypothetical protein E4T56_gene9983 [Termitomyces sp. T112]
MGKPDALSKRAYHGTGAGNNDNILLLTPDLFAIHALEGIVVQRDKGNILKDIQQGNWEDVQEDAVAHATQALQAQCDSGVKSLFSASEDLIPGCHPKPPPLPIPVNDEEEDKVEKNLNSRVFQEKLQFKMKGKGYGVEDISWEPQTNVWASAFVHDFYHRDLGALKAI